LVSIALKELRHNTYEESLIKTAWNYITSGIKKSLEKRVAVHNID
jgi:hypothetical protein